MSQVRGAGKARHGHGVSFAAAGDPAVVGLLAGQIIQPLDHGLQGVGRDVLGQDLLVGSQHGTGTGQPAMRRERARAPLCNLSRKTRRLAEPETGRFPRYVVPGMAILSLAYLSSALRRTSNRTMRTDVDGMSWNFTASSRRCGVSSSGIAGPFVRRHTTSRTAIDLPQLDTAQFGQPLRRAWASAIGLS